MKERDNAIHYRHKTNDDMYHRANDGTPFLTADETMNYVKNAGGLGDEVHKLRLVLADEDEVRDLFDIFASHISYYDVEIYRPKTEEDIELLRRYMAFYNQNNYPEVVEIDNSYIGKTVLLRFDEGRDSVFAQTTDMIVADFLEAIEKLIEKQKGD